MPTSVTHFEVQRDALGESRIIEQDIGDLEDGQVLLAVDEFGFTSNNVTYGVFGDMLGYWKFFPTDDPWGRIPVWGFADVVESSHPEIAVGARAYGYLPMSTHLVVQPVRVNARDFVDATPHRHVLPPAYNQYLLTSGDPNHDPSRERERMLFWPLFFTGFLIDDFFADNDFWKASTVILSSASSKTAISTAFLMKERGTVELVGLTSPRNRFLVASLGIYDRVVTYDDVAEMDDADALFVDMAGDAAVRLAVHERFGDRLAYSAIVGGTHWEAPPVEGELPGPPPTFFFAPDQIGRRIARSGQASLDAQIGDAWGRFVKWLDGWFRISAAAGPRAVQEAYLEVLAGRIDPSEGLALSMTPDGS